MLNRYKKSDLIPRSHIAKLGDTVDSIASEKGVSTQDILAYNPGLSRYQTIINGQRVDIPHDPVPVPEIMKEISTPP